MSSREVEDAEGEAPMRAIDILSEKRQALDAARAQYRRGKEARDEELMSEAMRRIDALLAMIPELEADVVAEREATASQQAKARVIAIKRALGSVSSSLDEDEKKLAELLEELTTRLNDRYEITTTLRAEALALSDRFDLGKPMLPDVASPARRAIAAALVRSVNKLRADGGGWEPTEQCEHKMRTRRTYAEAEGTPGGAIIEAVGPKPFPELTEHQRKLIAGKEREQEEMRRQFSGLPTSPAGIF